MKKKRLLVAIAMLIVLSFTACAAASPAPAPAVPSPAAAPASPAVSADLVVELAEPSGAVPWRAYGTLEPSGSGYLALPMLTPAQAGGRRLVYTVNMRLQTMEFMQGKRMLLNSVAEAGGYIISADVRGYDLSRQPTERSADFAFRIPTERLPEFIIFVENNYNIWGLQQWMQDATEQYQRTAWNLDDLREQENLLLERMESARGDELTELSSTLSGVRWTIRELEASQATLMDTVIYSTLSIQLFEVFEDERQPVNLVIIGLVVAVIVLIGFMAFSKNRSAKADEPSNGDTTKESDNQE